jgi:FKBP-type peptidyl-prolyl cis-trans isomerase
MKLSLPTLLFGALFVALSCNGEITGLEPPSNPESETFAPSLGVNLAQMTRLDNGVYYRDLIVGTGLVVTDTVESLNMNFAGYLTNGTLFESGSNVPFGLHEVIPGLRAGIIGMKEGGRRKLVIPSEQGYGGRSRRDPSTGRIVIPRQSTLIFDIDILKVVNPAPPTTP